MDSPVKHLISTKITLQKSTFVFIHSLEIVNVLREYRFLAIYLWNGHAYYKAHWNSWQRKLLHNPPKPGAAFSHFFLEGEKFLLPLVTFLPYRWLVLTIGHILVAFIFRCVYTDWNVPRERNTSEYWWKRLLIAPLVYFLLFVPNHARSKDSFTKLVQLLFSLCYVIQVGASSPVNRTSCYISARRFSAGCYVYSFKEALYAKLKINM